LFFEIPISFRARQAIKNATLVLPLNWIEPSENDPNQKSNQCLPHPIEAEFQNTSLFDPI